MYHDTACDAHIMHLYSIIVPFLNLASYKPCRGWSAEIDVSVDCLWFIWPQAITKKDSEPMEQRDFNNATLVHHAAVIAERAERGRVHHGIISGVCDLEALHSKLPGGMFSRGTSAARESRRSLQRQ